MRSGLAAALAIWAGCSMGVFEDLRDQATSQSHGPPGGISLGFGADVAFVPSDPMRDGMRFVVAGDNGPSLSTFVFDPDTGETSSAGIDLEGFVADLDNPPVVTGVENDFMGLAGGLVAFGIGDLSAVVLFAAGSGDEPPAERGVIRSQDCGLPPNVPRFGQHIVLADAGVGGGPPELIVAAGPALTVIQDLDPANLDCATCSLPGPVIGIAGIDLGGDAARELIVAFDVGGQTQLELISAQAALAQAGADCFPSRSGFSIPEPRYGEIIEVGNIDDDPRPDAILFKTGRDDLFVWLNLDFDPPTGPILVPTDQDIAGATSMAVVNVDAAARGELLIGVPVDSDENDDGRVDVFDLVVPSPGPPRLELRSTLRDSAAEDGQLYGRSLATAGFRRGNVITQLPIVGATEEVFAVFLADPEGEDPR